MIRSFLNRIAARRLAKQGYEKNRAKVIETTRRLRRELGLPDDRRLGAMRFQRRSGVLRTEPCFTVSALCAPAAIAEVRS